jgi:hypothetical protein
LADAFRELHASRLLGFALFVTLGDRQRATRLASRALAAGARRAEELRHPERGAAWLRQRVISAVSPGGTGWRGSNEARRMSLAALGVDSATYEALAQLTVAERAALVAGYVERFALLDLELILHAKPNEVRQQVLASRRRFLERHPLVVAAGGKTIDAGHGPLATRITSIANRAFARTAP